MDTVDRIKKLCQENKMTLAELERATGIGNGVIARWKKSSPSAEYVSRVAEYFGVTTDWLLGRTKQRSITFDGAALSAELKGKSISLEVMREIADSGLNAKQLRDALRWYSVYEKVYGGDDKK